MSRVLKCPSGHERKIPDDFPRDTASCNYCEHVFRLRKAEPTRKPPPAVTGTATAAAPHNPAAILLGAFAALVVGLLVLRGLGVIGPDPHPAGTSGASAMSPENWPAFEDIMRTASTPGFRASVERYPGRVTWIVDADAWARLSVEERKDLVHTASRTSSAAAAKFLGGSIHVRVENTRGREVATVNFWTGAIELQ